MFLNFRFFPSQHFYCLPSFQNLSSIREKYVVLFGSKLSIFYFKTLQIVIRKKESFQKYKKKQLSFFLKSLKNKQDCELFHRYFFVFFLLFNKTYLKEQLWLVASFISIEKLPKNLKIPHSRLFQGEYLFPGGSTYLIVNKHWRSIYFPVNDYWAVLFSGEYLWESTCTSPYGELGNFSN